MKLTEKQTSRIREIAEEHAAIGATMRRIRLELDRLLNDPAGPDDGWELPGLLNSFYEHLERHFALEESGGLIGDARQYYDPGMQRKVDALLADHREFRRRLRRILSEVDGGIVPNATVQACHDQELRRLLDDLVQHETVENSLFLELVGRDVGAPD
jgi:iron-sulfur cluster repair protein YtfE (RIC family)